MNNPDRMITVREAAATVGCHIDWARHIVRRYNAEGPDGLVDKRAGNPGQAPLLSTIQKEELSQALLGAAPDGGLWTGIKVSGWIHEKTGKDAPSDTTGLNYLHKLGFTLQRPRPHNIQAASPEEQASFKKSLVVRSVA
jgi:transposase